MGVHAARAESLAMRGKIASRGAPTRRCADRRARRAPAHQTQGRSLVKVIASSLRKGNVVDIDGKLYVVLTAENIHPGKGTPVTQLDMRRISDGVKISERYRTTEQVERAFVEDREHSFLYQDGDGFHFMNPETYDQVTVPKDVIGDQARLPAGGHDGACSSLHDGMPIAIELPQRGDARDRRDRAGDEGPDRLVVLQAGDAVERRAHHGAAAHRRRHPRRDHDRGRLLRGTRQG